MVVTVELLDTKNNFGFLPLPSDLQRVRSKFCCLGHFSPYPVLTLAMSSSSMAEAQTSSNDKIVPFIVNCCSDDRCSKLCPL